MSICGLHPEAGRVPAGGRPEVRCLFDPDRRGRKSVNGERL